MRNLVLGGIILALLGGCWSPPDANERLQRADSYYASGDYGAAIIELKNLLQGQPDHAAARLKLGKLYTEIGRGVTAEKELRKAMTLGIPREHLKVYLGRAYGLQGRFEDVINKIDIAPADNTDTRVVLHVIRGRAFLGTGKLEDAKREFSAALESEPGHMPALTSLARTYIAQGNTDEASKVIQRALELDAKDPLAWEVEGKLAQDRGDYGKAAESYGRALALIDEKKKSRMAYRFRLGLTIAYMSRKEDSKAMEQVLVLKKLTTKNPLPPYLEALLLYRGKDYTKSTEKSLALLKDNPDNKAMLALLGVTNYRLGSLELANMYLSKLIAGDPANQAALRLLAMTRAQLGQHTNIRDGLESILKDYGETGQILRTIGVLATRAGDYKAGIEYIEKALAQEPDNTELQYELISAYIGAGQAEKALQQLQSMQQASDDSRSYLRHTLLSVMAYMGSNDNQRALETAQALVRKRPDDPIAANLLGSVFLKAGKTAEAQKQFEEIVRRHPGNRAALLRLAALAYRADDLATARARYEEILANHPKEVKAMVATAMIDTRRGMLDEAGQRLEEATTLQPDSLELSLLLARNYLSRKKTESALRLLQTLAHKHPDSEKVLNMLGVVQMESGEHGAAIRTFKSTIEKFSPSAGRYYNLARVQIAAGVNGREVIETLRKALKQEQWHAPSLVTLTQLYIKTGDKKAASRLVRDLQKHDPENVLGYALGGYVHMQRGEFKLAVRDYEQAVARERTNMAVWRLSAARAAAGMIAPYRPLVEWLEEHGDDLATRQLLVSAYSSSGKNEEALEQYRQIILRRPGYVPVLNNAAWLCLQLEKDCALEYSRKAYKIAPANAAVIDTLALAELKVGDAARAVDLLRKATALQPENREIAYHLALALSEQGIKQEALSILERVTVTDKPFGSLEDARSLQKKLLATETAR